MSMESALLDGLLVVDKPGRDDLTPIPFDPDAVETTEKKPHRGLLSSHDVVARIRRWSGQRRIGHTGTLDPLASGVLVLCLGSAVRLVEYYQNHPKRYRGGRRGRLSGRVRRRCGHGGCGCGYTGGRFAPHGGGGCVHRVYELHGPCMRPGGRAGECRCRDACCGRCS